LRRISLCVVTGVIAWPVAAMWGHAEDSLALALVLYAVIALLDRKWRTCGWLLGCAVVIQPLAALAVPLMIGATPTGQRVALAIRSVVISAVLVTVAFIGDPADTFQMVVKQPTQPTVNHATPWASLAPRVSSYILAPESHTSRSPVRGYAFHGVPTPRYLAAVSGGPGRMIDVVVALTIAVYVWRRPQNPVRFVWLVAVVLASRCFFEAVMTPYYLAPPLILGLALAARRGRLQFAGATVIAFGVTVFAYHRCGPWAWWAPIVVGLGMILALGFPAKQPESDRSLPNGSALRTESRPAHDSEDRVTLVGMGAASVSEPVSVGHGPG
jgi:hypothetical protein